MIRQSEHHDSGWGMAVYERAEGRPPVLVRFPEAAYTDAEFERATTMTGRIFNVHVRRATLGGLTLVNTHPFVLGNYSFGHNGTVIAYPRLIEPGVQPPAGETDSEAIFNYLMRYFDPADVPGVAAPRDVGRGRALGVLGAELPLLGRRAAVRVPHGHLRPALAGPRRPVDGVLRARDGRGVAHGAAGRAAHARSVQSRGAPCRATAGRRARGPGRTSTPSRSRPICVEPSAAPLPPSALRAWRQQPIEPPVPPAGQPVRGRGAGAQASGSHGGRAGPAGRRPPHGPDA